MKMYRLNNFAMIKLHSVFRLTAKWHAVRCGNEKRSALRIIDRVYAHFGANVSITRLSSYLVQALER